MSNKKPVIGVTSIYDSKLKNVWMLDGYTDRIYEAGGLPVIIPISVDKQDIQLYLNICDGFLFTGGDDINPAIYGEENTLSKDVYDKKDIMESLMLCNLMSMDKSVLGICRGFQLMNAVFGGTLCQDINTQLETKTEHKQKSPASNPSHKIEICSGTSLFKIFGINEVEVNSLHHQCVKKLSPVLRTSAIAEDGIIEGAELPGKKFFMGVQWHPEMTSKDDANSKKLFEAFIKSAII